MANAVPVERLHLGLTPRRGLRAGSLWQGRPSDLIFAGDAGHLAEIAEAVAVKLSQPGHEISAKPVSREQLRRARHSRDFTLALDVVRQPGGGPIGPLIALATADRPSLGRSIARKPPNISYKQPAHHLTTAMRIGVLGGLAVRGGVASGVLLAYHRSGHGIALGASYRGR